MRFASCPLANPCGRLNRSAARSGIRYRSTAKDREFQPRARSRRGVVAPPDALLPALGAGADHAVHLVREAHTAIVERLRGRSAASADAALMADRTIRAAAPLHGGSGGGDRARGRASATGSVGLFERRPGTAGREADHDRDDERGQRTRRSHRVHSRAKSLTTAMCCMFGETLSSMSAGAMSLSGT